MRVMCVTREGNIPHLEELIKQAMSEGAPDMELVANEVGVDIVEVYAVDPDNRGMVTDWLEHIQPDVFEIEVRDQNDENTRININSALDAHTLVELTLV